MSAEVDNTYREAFGADFSKMDEEAKARADKLIAAASSPAYVLDVRTGRMMPNPIRADFDKMVAAGAINSQFAQQLGVYAGWRAGMIPKTSQLSELTKAAARRAGVPVDKIEKEVGDRKVAMQDWAKGVLNRFAHLVPAEANTPKEKDASIKIDSKKKPAPIVEVTPEVVIAKPVAAAPAPQGAEGAPIQPAISAAPPPVQAAEPVAPVSGEPPLPTPIVPQWTKQQLVNGQYVPME